jgi:hypothetical protein
MKNSNSSRRDQFSMSRYRAIFSGSLLQSNRQAKASRLVFDQDGYSFSGRLVRLWSTRLCLKNPSISSLKGVNRIIAAEQRNVYSHAIARAPSINIYVPTARFCPDRAMTFEAKAGRPVGEVNGIFIAHSANCRSDPMSFVERRPRESSTQHSVDLDVCVNKPRSGDRV